MGLLCEVELVLLVVLVGGVELDVVVVVVVVVVGELLDVELELLDELLEDSVVVLELVELPLVVLLVLEKLDVALVGSSSSMLSEPDVVDTLFNRALGETGALAGAPRVASVAKMVAVASAIKLMVMPLIAMECGVSGLKGGVVIFRALSVRLNSPGINYSIRSSYWSP